MKRTFSFLLPLLLLSCTNNDTTGSKAPLQNTALSDTVRQIVNTPLIGLVTDLEFSKTITERLDAACGAYYTYDTCKLTDEKYVFISDASDKAIMKVNGKNISLDRDENESEQLGEKSFKDVYKGGNYTVVLTVKETGNYDTGSYSSGTLQISSNHLNEAIKVHGKAGC